jgi:hypothetical protein
MIEVVNFGTNSIATALVGLGVYDEESAFSQSSHGSIVLLCVH